MGVQQDQPQVTQQIELCRRLREEIILGHLNNGQRITEKFISERMGVKRGPARESLLILEGQGLIRKVPSLGYFVASHSEEDVRDVYDVRLALETLAVRRAALHASREALVRMALICEDHRRAVQNHDVPARVRSDLEFHEAIVRASGSLVIERAYASIARPLYGKTVLSSKRAECVSAQHEAIYESIRDHDADLAAKLLAQHISEHSLSDNGGEAFAAQTAAAITA